MTLAEVTKEVERIVFEDFYPGPISGSTQRLAAALIGAFPAIASPPPEQPLTGWRPIETAPRDGKSIIVGHQANVWEDHRIIPGTKAKDGMPLDGRDFQCVNHYGYPTHWQPLPSPPTQETNHERG